MKLCDDHEYFYKQFLNVTTKIWVIVVFGFWRRETNRPSERFCMTLRYLVTGDAQISIASSYRVSPTSITRIVEETCEVLWNVLLQEGYPKCPTTTCEWKEVSQALWDFPNCVGAIDGKINASSCSGWINFHSIVLLAVYNAKYEIYNGRYWTNWKK